MYDTDGINNLTYITFNTIQEKVFNKTKIKHFSLIPGPGWYRYLVPGRRYITGIPGPVHGSAMHTTTSPVAYIIFYLFFVEAITYCSKRIIIKLLRHLPS
jgi:hypothetical protein